MCAPVIHEENRWGARWHGCCSFHVTKRSHAGLLVPPANPARGASIFAAPGHDVRGLFLFRRPTTSTIPLGWRGVNLAGTVPGGCRRKAQQDTNRTKRVLVPSGPDASTVLGRQVSERFQDWAADHERLQVDLEIRGCRAARDG